MRRTIIIVMVATLVGLTTACGDGGGSSGSATTSPSDAQARELDGFVKGFLGSSNGVITKADAECVGRKLLPAMSDKAKHALNSDKGGIEDLSGAERTALYDSFDGCVGVAAMAKTIASGLTEGTGGTSAETARCVEQKITQTFHRSSDLMRELLDPKGDRSTFESTLVGCATPTSP
jgi:hypothetical protein